MNNSVRSSKPDVRDFVQYTRGYLRAQRELARRSPAAWQVFTLLTERMNKANAIVISQAVIAQILGYTRTTVNSAVKLLEKEKWVQVIKIGQVNAYAVNRKVVWRDKDGKRYAGFFASVVASEDEQVQPIENWEGLELRSVPVLMPGELPIVGDEALPPPDQIDLLPPDDALEFPRTGDQAERDDLEARGQLRIPHDPETGEVLPAPATPARKPRASKSRSTKQ